MDLIHFPTWPLWWPGTRWEQLLARQRRWRRFSALVDASWEMKSGIRPWHLSHYAPVHPRRWRPTAWSNLGALRVMNASVAPRWPAKEPRPQKSKPGCAPPWCCNDKKILQRMWCRSFWSKWQQLERKNSCHNTERLQTNVPFTISTVVSKWCANIHLWVGPSFSYKWLSDGAVKLVSKDVCPLRWLQRFLPDCIRTCVEKRIIRLQKHSAALRCWATFDCGAFRHPRILKSLPDLVHKNK